MLGVKPALAIFLAVAAGGLLILPDLLRGAPQPVIDPVQIRQPEGVDRKRERGDEDRRDSGRNGEAERNGARDASPSGGDGGTAETYPGTPAPGPAPAPATQPSSGDDRGGGDGGGSSPGSQPNSSQPAPPPAPAPAPPPAPVPVDDDDDDDDVGDDDSVSGDD